MFEIRRATPIDSSAWLRMRTALWPAEDVAEDVDRFFDGKLDMPLEVLVAVDGFGELIGFAELSIRRYAEGCATDRVAFLEGWYVDEAHRRKGVGAALVASAEAWARKQGCTEFGSDALLENEISAAAHKALGFEEVECIRCFKKVLV
ncbi:MAG: aminoglycoside 6'-N-acetyltransferase [Vicinamibacterales bacterium]